MREADWNEEPLFERIKPFKRHGHKYGGIRRHLPACNGKRSYRSKDEALDAAQALIDSNLAYFLRVYRCPICTKWHLTSKALRARR